MSAEDPKRLSEDATQPTELREGLQALREGAPSDAARERMALAIGAATASPPSVEPEPPQVDAGGTEAVGAQSTGATPTAPTAPPPTAVASGAVAATTKVGLIGKAVLAAGVAGTLSVVAWQQSQPSGATESRPPPRAAPETPALVEASAPEEAVPDPAEVPKAAPQPEATPARVARRRRVRRASSGKAESAPAPVSPAPEPAAPSPEEELLLLHARRLLQSDAKQALALTRQHRRRFPDAMLAQERDVIAIAALVQLVRKDEARRAFERFEQRYPRSIHLRKLRTLTEHAP